MIKAINDHVVVEELKRTKTKGGIILPDKAEDPQGYGKVLSVGEEVKNTKEGDIIVFHNRGGQAALIGNKFLRILKNNEIYGILEDKQTLEVLVHLHIASEEKETSNIIQPVS